MKAIYKFLCGCIILTLLLGGIPMNVFAGTNSEGPAESSGMPGWPMPKKPIPHTEVGQVSKAGSYRTTVQVEKPVIDELTGLATGKVNTKNVKLSGVDALAADGLDPLAGNYTLMNRESILVGSLNGTTANLKTYQTGAGAVPVSLADISGGGANLGSIVDYDVTSGDLNGDGQAEQVAATTDSGNAISLAIGETPGYTRATSAPAMVVHSGGAMDLLVRGYDEALWHIRYDGSNWGTWENNAGGTLISAPALASVGNGTFDAFVLGTDNCTYQRHYYGSFWGADWARVEASSADCPALNAWVGATPEFPAPAAVANGSGLDLFRLGSDNTLQWNHSSDEVTWDGWQSLGGMLATSPAAVSTGAGQVQVFALGADGALWFRVYNGSWGAWQRSVLSGVDAGVTFSYAPGVGTDLKVYLLGSDQQMWQAQCDSTSCGVWTSTTTPTDDALASGIAVGSGSWQFLARAEGGQLQSSGDGSAWSQFASLSSIGFNATIGRTTQNKNNGWTSYSVRIRSGYFLGDGRQQLALGYFTASNQVTVVAYQTAGGFQPVQLATYTLNGLEWFDMTTGDFLNNDGIDEIAVGYYNADTSGVIILEFSGGTLQFAKQVYGGAGGTDFAGSLAIVAGNFDGDEADEVAMAWVEYSNDTYGGCPSWHIGFHFLVYDVSPDGTFKKYEIQDESYFAPPGNTLWQQQNISQLGISLASGDVNGDGRDEILRTWPTTDWQQSTIWCGIFQQTATIISFKRVAQAITLPNDPSKWPSNGTIASGDIAKTTVASKNDYTNVSMKDRLAVGDINRDSKNEIVWVTGLYTLSAYYKTPAGYAAFANDLTPDSSTNYPTLIIDNFTRENLRVGQPTYRVQNRVDSLMALINVPPKHKDLVKDSGGNYQLIESPQEECTPSAQDEGCTHAKFAKKSFTGTSEEVSTKRDFTLSAGMEGEACAQGGSEDATSIKGCVNASVEYTYGANFENTTTAITSTTFTTQVIASQDDKVIYYGTPIGMWEYPVLEANSEGAVGYMSVAFPLVASSAYPSSADGYSAGACDETWFHAGHQVNNIWSYDPIGTIRFPDYDSLRQVYRATHDGGASGSITFDTSNETLSSQEYSHEIKASLGLEVSGTAGEKDVAQTTGSLKATVSGDYTGTGQQTDKVTTSESTEYSFALSNQPPATKFQTNVVFYWALGGYQTINYQTEPGSTVSWNLYNKADPAFILPWYGFPYPETNPALPPCGPQKQLFSPNIVVEKQNLLGAWIPVTTAEPGDQVRLTATVRNFSNVPTPDVKVRFYLGNPSAGNQIGESVIPGFYRSGGPQQAPYVNWTVTGGGGQNIFAVIDPDNSILEVHDGDDLVDNNIGYGLLKIGTSGYSEMGAAQQHPYDTISYQMPTGEAVEPTVSFQMPRTSQTAVTRFELKDYGSDLPVAGRVFELIAYQGSASTNWNTPIPSFNLRPDADTPPSLLSFDYAGAGYSDTLTLWRWTTSNVWENATCAGFETTSFPDNDYLVVPVCKTGIYAFAETIPGLVENIPPTVTAITRLNSNPTSKKSVAFKVVFSEDVTGVDKTDFTLTKTGTLTGYSVASVTGANKVYTVTINTGSGNGTLRLDVLKNGSIKDTFGNTLAAPFTAGQVYTVKRMLTFISQAANDGWILETGEKTSLGGTFNATADNFNLGDDAANKQYRGLLSFSTASLPDNAVITKITLKMTKKSITGGGNPIATFQGFLVDVKKGYLGTFAALQAADFQATGNATLTIPTVTPIGNLYSLNLTNAKASINPFAANGGLTQIRLRFKLDDNNNTVANYMSFYSSNFATVANRPQLIIEYYVP